MIGVALFAALLMQIPFGAAPARLTELALETLLRDEARASKAGLTRQGPYWQGSPVVAIDGVAFYFGDRARPAVLKTSGRIDTGPIVFTPPLEAYDYAPRPSCPASAIEALRRLAAEARRKGGNAVVDVRSDPGNPAYATPFAIVCKGSEVRLTGEIVSLDTAASRVAAGTRPPR